MCSSTVTESIAAVSSEPSASVESDEEDDMPLSKLVEIMKTKNPQIIVEDLLEDDIPTEETLDD